MWQRPRGPPAPGRFSPAVPRQGSPRGSRKNRCARSPHADDVVVQVSPACRERASDFQLACRRSSRARPATPAPYNPPLVPGGSVRRGRHLPAPQIAPPASLAPPPWPAGPPRLAIETLPSLPRGRVRHETPPVSVIAPRRRNRRQRATRGLECAFEAANRKTRAKSSDSPQCLNVCNIHF